MITDLEKTTKFLTDLDIKYYTSREEDSNDVTIGLVGSVGFAGYSTEFEFNKHGAFIDVGVWS